MSISSVSMAVMKLSTGEMSVPNQWVSETGSVYIEGFMEAEHPPSMTEFCVFK